MKLSLRDNEGDAGVSLVSLEQARRCLSHMRDWNYSYVCTVKQYGILNVQVCRWSVCSASRYASLAVLFISYS